MSITVHQAFEYVFMIFFFIFIIKQIRKLYDSFVYEENQRTKVESGISGSYIESKWYVPNNFHKGYTQRGKKSTYYSGYTEGNIFDDAVRNPDDYENIKFTDYTEE